MSTHNYNIGTGIADITLKKPDNQGIGMLGFSIPCQKTDGNILHTLHSRAFAIHDSTTNKYVMIVIADIWSCTERIKDLVITKLQESIDLAHYSFDNVMISGTHTHSSPGGYCYPKYRMYTVSTRAKKQQDKIQKNIDTIVDGIATSIKRAHNNLKPGKIFIHKGDKINNRIDGCGHNRSANAYCQNDKDDINHYNSKTDNYMQLIKFVHNNGDKPIGIISWFPIHPADIGQHNKFISGDNKGHAAHLFENEMKKIGIGSQNQPFVAAFANSNCGDVSGNVVYKVVNGERKKIIRPPKGGALNKKKNQDIKTMMKHGQLQFDKALELFNATELEELTGSIDFQYLHSVDMSKQKNIHGNPKKRTYIPATGLAAYAGSKEDGTTPFLPFNALDEDKGLRKNNLDPSERATLISIQALTSGEGPIEPALAVLANIVAISTLDSIPVGRLTQQQIEGHSLKPIAVVAKGIVPSLLPMQLFKIGNLVIPAIPGELTTMAGRYLRKTLEEAFKDTEVKYVALGTYSNAYSQYITTEPEYEYQSYEGASTLFGPHTLGAYQQIFERLAKKILERMQQAAPPLLANTNKVHHTNGTIPSTKKCVYCGNDKEASELIKEPLFTKEIGGENLPFTIESCSFCSDFGQFKQDDQRFFAKLGLGLGALELNPNFILSEPAEILRDFMLETNKAKRDAIPLYEVDSFFSYPNMSYLKDFFQWDGAHLFALMTVQDKLVLYASILEKEPTVITLSENPNDWEDKFDSGIVYVILPDSQKFAKISLEDFLAHKHEDVDYSHPRLTLL